MRFGFEPRRVLMMSEHRSGPGETGHLALESLAGSFQGAVMRPPVLKLWVAVSSCASAPPTNIQVFPGKGGVGIGKMTVMAGWCSHSFFTC